MRKNIPLKWVLICKQLEYRKAGVIKSMVHRKAYCSCKLMQILDNKSTENEKGFTNCFMVKR